MGINMTSEFLHLLSEQWRSELLTFLQSSSPEPRTVMVLLTDLGSLVPRPALLPKTATLMEVTMQDPGRRFKLTGKAGTSRMGLSEGYLQTLGQTARHCGDGSDGHISTPLAGGSAGERAEGPAAPHYCKHRPTTICTSSNAYGSSYVPSNGSGSGSGAAHSPPDSSNTFTGTGDFLAALRRPPTGSITSAALSPASHPPPGFDGRPQHITTPQQQQQQQ